MSIHLSQQTILQQKLTITPQLKQSLRFLQLSNAALAEQIKDLADNNVFLEYEPYQTGRSHSNNFSNNAQDFNFDNITDSSDPSLQQHLIEQLQFMHLSEIENEIVLIIIDLLDEDGMLRVSDDVIKQELPDVEDKQIARILKTIQQLDPAGVAARNLQECLLLQLKRKPTKVRWLDEAITICQSQLDLLNKKKYKQIQRLTGYAEEQINGALELIRTLNLRPGSDFKAKNNYVIIPDAVVKKINNRWQAIFNSSILPKLSLNYDYIILLKKHKYSKEQNKDQKLLQEQLQQARSLINNLAYRNNSLISTINYIVDYQQDFFEYGEHRMNPLLAKDLAVVLELHKSTVSRIIANKFIQTSQGMLPLKYFFSSFIQDDNGHGYSSTAIRALIKHLIKQESKEKPLSDVRITQLLQQQGIKIARRTVVKYRHILGFASANVRRGHDTSI